VRKADFSEPL